MAKKRPARPQPEQLVFPFALRVGDVVGDERVHRVSSVVSRTPRPAG